MLELILSHDGNHWHARGPGIDLKAGSLSGLDEQLKNHLDASRGPADVRMCFDCNALPRWMRQYGSHYFNRLVRFDFEDRGETTHHDNPGRRR